MLLQFFLCRLLGLITRSEGNLIGKSIWNELGNVKNRFFFLFFKFFAFFFGWVVCVFCLIYPSWFCLFMSCDRRRKGGLSLNVSNLTCSSFFFFVSDFSVSVSLCICVLKLYWVLYSLCEHVYWGGFNIVYWLLVERIECAEF